MGITFQVSKFNFKLRRLAKQQPEKAKKAMADVAHYLEGESKDRAPIEEGILTESIRGEVQTSSGKTAAVVKVPLNSPAAHYAIPMHEGNYNIGQLSQGKQNNLGVRVGRKYITRAISENRRTIKEIIKDKLKV